MTIEHLLHSGGLLRALYMGDFFESPNNPGHRSLSPEEPEAQGAGVG